MKPVLLLDVDGVLNIGGDQRETVHLPGTFLPLWACRNWKSFLRKVDQISELVWCTCWMERANFIGKAAGIPERPHIPMVAIEGKDQDWKCVSVDRMFPDPARKLVWVEDGFRDDTRQWAKRRGNMKLIHVRFLSGLTKRTMRKVIRHLSKGD
jgi:hypothetical protein